MNVNTFPFSKDTKLHRQAVNKKENYNLCKEKYIRSEQDLQWLLGTCDGSTR